jgi:YHS domain-containing protein
MKRNFMKIYKNVAKSFSLFALAMIITGALFASTNAQTEQSKDSALVQVETKYVCMINNQKFDKEQIAVEVSGQTYYGCCEMCKDKLKNDAKSRTAVDPVSGKKVDKAKAVIGANAEGKVFYFENAENLKKYNATPAATGDKKEAEHKAHHHK